jgi:hypothetical protein
MQWSFTPAWTGRLAHTPDCLHACGTAEVLILTWWLLIYCGVLAVQDTPKHGQQHKSCSEVTIEQPSIIGCLQLVSELRGHVATVACCRSQDLDRTDDAGSFGHLNGREAGGRISPSDSSQGNKGSVTVRYTNCVI